MLVPFRFTFVIFSACKLWMCALCADVFAMNGLKPDCVSHATVCVSVTAEPVLLPVVPLLLQAGKRATSAAAQTNCIAILACFICSFQGAHALRERSV